MAGQDRHEEARALAEQALGKFAEGDSRQGNALADKAVGIDRSAVEEVVAEIDEDAGSDHAAGAGAAEAEGGEDDAGDETEWSRRPV